MSERDVLAEFSGEITDALFSHDESLEADVLTTCLKRLHDDHQAVMTTEARIAFARLVDVPEHVLDVTPEQARAAHTYVAAARELRRVGVTPNALDVFVNATSPTDPQPTTESACERPRE